MTRRLRLMCILAHPDDETLGFGGVLAKYAAEGVDTYVVTATRGEHGWFGPPDDYPGPTALGRTREAELRAAAEVLGVREVTLLDYIDGELGQADRAEATAKLAAVIRRAQPDVVLTFGPDGIYGHPDHIAISQFATAAVVEAADAASGDAAAAPHRVSKLYYRATSPAYLRLYETAFGDLAMDIDGVERRGPGWPEWAITTRVDAAVHWRQVWEAVQRHRSQLPGYETLRRLPEGHHERMWGEQDYYRAFSLVNAPNVEVDLLEGLQPQAQQTGSPVAVAVSATPA